MKELFKKKIPPLESFFTPFGRKFARKDDWEVFGGKEKKVI